MGPTDLRLELDLVQRPGQPGKPGGRTGPERQARFVPLDEDVLQREGRTGHPEAGLPVGKLSDIIKTQYGYHIIRVEDRRPMQLEAVRGILANELAHRDLDQVIANGFKLNMAYFGK